LLLRPVASDFRQPGARPRLNGTSACRQPGLHDAKGALADHYARASGHTSSGSPVYIVSHDNENRSKEISEKNRRKLYHRKAFEEVFSYSHFLRISPVFRGAFTKVERVGRECFWVFRPIFIAFTK
jgi:hypothetical protein